MLDSNDEERTWTRRARPCRRRARAHKRTPHSLRNRDWECPGLRRLHFSAVSTDSFSLSSRECRYLLPGMCTQFSSPPRANSSKPVARSDRGTACCLCAGHHGLWRRTPFNDGVMEHTTSLRSARRPLRGTSLCRTRSGRQFVREVLLGRQITFQKDELVGCYRNMPPGRSKRTRPIGVRRNPALGLTLSDKNYPE